MGQPSVQERALLLHHPAAAAPALATRTSDQACGRLLSARLPAQGCSAQEGCSVLLLTTVLATCPESQKALSAHMSRLTSQLMLHTDGDSTGTPRARRLHLPARGSQHGVLRMRAQSCRRRGGAAAACSSSRAPGQPRARGAAHRVAQIVPALLASGRQQGLLQCSLARASGRHGSLPLSTYSLRSNRQQELCSTMLWL